MAGGRPDRNTHRQADGDRSSISSSLDLQIHPACVFSLSAKIQNQTIRLHQAKHREEGSYTEGSAWTPPFQPCARYRLRSPPDSFQGHDGQEESSCCWRPGFLHFSTCRTTVPSERCPPPDGLARPLTLDEYVNDLTYSGLIVFEVVTNAAS